MLEQHLMLVIELMTIALVIKTTSSNKEDTTCPHDCVNCPKFIHYAASTVLFKNILSDKWFDNLKDYLQTSFTQNKICDENFL